MSLKIKTVQKFNPQKIDEFWELNAGERLEWLAQALEFMYKAADADDREHWVERVHRQTPGMDSSKTY